MNTRLFTLGAPAALLATLAAAPASAQTIQTLVIEGDTVTGVGNVTSVSNLAINVAGDWLVELDTDGADTNTDGALLMNGALIFQEGQALAMPVGAMLDSFDDLSINSLGDFSNNFFLDGTTGTTDDSGIYWNSVLVLQESTVSTAAGFSAGTPYIGFFGTKINAVNQILVMASVDDPAISSTVDRALVIMQVDGSGNLLSETVFAKEGDVLPGVAPETVTDFGTGPHEWAFNDLGQIMFVADLTGLTTTNAAIYIDNTLIAREGDPSPVAGRNWSSLSSVELDLSNDGTHYVFSASLDGDSASNLLIVKDGGKLVQEGDSLPATGGFTFTSFGSGPVHVSNAGDVLWYGDWNDANLDIDTGLFLNDQLLVQEGVTTIGGVIVDSLSGISDGYALSDDGRYVIFEATLVDGNNGTFLIDLAGGPQVFCAGDGSGTPCPCGNTGGAGEGCANSTAQGGVLGFMGTVSVAANDLTLTGGQLVPSQPGLYFQGDNAVNGGAGNAFGDGLRCAGGSVRRLEVVTASVTGNSQTSVGIASLGAVAPGDTKRYQLWYRDPTGSPCGTGFNFPNGLEVVWEP